MSKRITIDLEKELFRLKSLGLYKNERIIASPQKSVVELQPSKKAINMCSNNYLGLANHPRVIEASKKGLSNYGFGLSSVRFICGTQNIHKELEKRISCFMQMEDAILYSSCFDANTGLFETLLSSEDAIFSDALNHASIIDGVRLCKAKRFRYRNNDMKDLEEQLKKAEGCRYRLIATDGVFSMDGSIAKLKSICDLADDYDAFVMVDDSHGIGFLGENGRGSIEYCDVMGRVDIVTGTLGKALGGASGGYITGDRNLVSFLRQRSRPYLFSNSLSPVVVAASLEVFNIIEESDDLRLRLRENTHYFRNKMLAFGFDILPGEHPIVPLMLGDALLAKKFADLMLEEGIYVISFSYPVVPEEKARIRVQISAIHTKEELDQALEAFVNVGTKLGAISATTV